jgi:LysR family transcriptional regulator AphB
MVSRRVGQVTLGLYASPEYVARAGAPRNLDELASRAWVSYGRDEGVLRHVASALAITPRIVCDDMGFVREALREGAGIGALPTYLAAADVASGALVPVLPRWSGGAGTVVLVYPARKNLPRKVTAFCAVVEEMLRFRPIG